MSRRWIKERKKDNYYRLAKARGYRSRAAYKLKQINKKFDLISEGDFVVDLGAAPGSWSQVCLEIVGKHGVVLAVDKKRMREIEGVRYLRGDLTKEETFQLLRDEIVRRADVVISDMAPRLSGNKHIDHARSIYLAEMALQFARQTLKRGGNFCAKVFQGDMLGDFLRTASKHFESCQLFSPPASSLRSRETFLIARRFLG